MTPPILGTTAPGWEHLRDVFAANWDGGEEIGAAFSAYHRGRLVADLTGGWFDQSRTRPYDEQTLQLVFSTTKGITAIAVAMCVERGLLDYDATVASVWPEFAAAGKESVTVAQLLSHQAGLYTVDGQPTLADALDWGRSRPSWPRRRRCGRSAVRTATTQSPTAGWRASSCVGSIPHTAASVASSPRRSSGRSAGSSGSGSPRASSAGCRRSSGAGARVTTRTSTPRSGR